MSKLKDDREKKLYDKKLLHPVFDRQMRIPGWKQEKIEKTVALCLGVGGLGSTVCIALCRLGIKKMFIFDFDVVDEHNLNRQQVYGKKDINVLKVKAAKKNLENLHSIQTEIVEFNGNVLEHWEKVVDAAKESTVCFNMIDVGEKYDDCVQSLCLDLKIPLINGGTMQNFMAFDICTWGGACLGCMKYVEKVDEEFTKKIAPGKMVSYKKISDFIQREEMNNLCGASNFLVATTCSNFMVSLFVNHIMGEDYCHKKISRGIYYMNVFDMETYNLKRKKDCYLCSSFYKEE